MKKDRTSVYHRALDQWLDYRKAGKWVFPRWLKGVLICGFLLLVLVFGGNMALRAKVNAKTRELSLKNRELRNEINERRRAEAALQKKTDELDTVLTNIEQGIAYLDEKDNVIYLNHQC